MTDALVFLTRVAGILLMLAGGVLLVLFLYFGWRILRFQGPVRYENCLVGNGRRCRLESRRRISNETCDRVLGR